MLDLLEDVIGVRRVKAVASAAGSAGSGESREASWPARATSPLQSLFAKLVIDFSLILPVVSRADRLAKAGALTGSERTS